MAIKNNSTKTPDKRNPFGSPHAVDMMVDIRNAATVIETLLEAAFDTGSSLKPTPEQVNDTQALVTAASDHARALKKEAQYAVDYLCDKELDA